jgi:hypothetical protein
MSTPCGHGGCPCFRASRPQARARSMRRAPCSAGALLAYRRPGGFVSTHASPRIQIYMPTAGPSSPCAYGGALLAVGTSRRPRAACVCTHSIRQVHACIHTRVHHSIRQADSPAGHICICMYPRTMCASLFKACPVRNGFSDVKCVCVRARKSVCVCARAHARTRAFVCACVCVCVRACPPAPRARPGPRWRSS